MDTAAIERFMVENLARTGLGGALLAVTRNGRILYTAGYGYTSDEARVTPDTPMPIASLTKSFTAAAIMLLVEEGILVLDAPVRDYLPELELTDPRAARITLRHLLNQSSGLASAALPPSPERLATSLAERIDWLRDASLVSEPGAEFNYCNDNYNVLARVIERVSDMPYAQFLEARLFRPLGLVSSRAYLTTRDTMPGVADGHLLVYGALVAARMPAEVTAGAGGMVSSANDLARWLVLHGSGGNTVGGESLLSPQSVTAMHTASAPQSNYGFGWRQDSLPDGTTQVHHSGVLQTFTAHEKLFPSSGASRVPRCAWPSRRGRGYFMCLGYAGHSAW